jgi:hypothetical protein
MLWMGGLPQRHLVPILRKSQPKPESTRIKRMKRMYRTSRTDQPDQIDQLEELAMSHLPAQATRRGPDLLLLFASARVRRSAAQPIFPKS